MPSCVLLCFLRQKSPYAAQDGLKLAIVLPPSSDCWDVRHEPTTAAWLLDSELNHLPQEAY